MAGIKLKKEHQVTRTDTFRRGTREDSVMRKLHKAIDFSRHDTEKGHKEADMAIAQFLHELGYVEVVTLYDRVPKWYS